MPQGKLEKRATIRDVARLAKVSDMTVSRVVNNSGPVTPETRRAVVKAIDTLGYHPNAIAQSMRQARTRTVGFIIPDLTNITNAAIAQAIESEIARAGYQMLLVSTQSNTDKELAAIQLLKNQRVEGAAILISDETSAPVLAAVGKIGVPVVLLDRDSPLDVDAVLSKHREPVVDAITYLVTLGHRRIAAVLPPIEIRAGRLRREGYVAGLTQHGLEVDEGLIVHGAPSVDGGRELALGLLQGTDRPTALIVGTNQLTLGVMQAVRELNLSVPNDISVIGSDDIVTTSILSPPLTIMWRDMAVFGHRAAELLVSRVEGFSGPPRHVVLPTELILRRSCAPPNAAAPQPPRRSAKRGTAPR